MSHQAILADVVSRVGPADVARERIEVFLQETRSLVDIALGSGHAGHVDAGPFLPELPPVRSPRLASTLRRAQELNGLDLRVPGHLALVVLALKAAS